MCMIPKHGAITMSIMTGIAGMHTVGNTSAVATDLIVCPCDTCTDSGRSGIGSMQAPSRMALHGRVRTVCPAEPGDFSGFRRNEYRRNRVPDSLSRLAGKPGFLMRDRRQRDAGREGLTDSAREE